MPGLRTLALTLLVGLAAPLIDARDNTPLPPAVGRALEHANIPGSHVSIYVRKANTDEVVIDYNADVPRSPASTIKTLTTFVALDSLGPAFTWKTRAYATGRVVNGVLNGDLVIQGGGDPYMTSERWWNFAQTVRQSGIRKIQGDLVIDRTYFSGSEGDRAGFDAQPFRSYNVLPDALMVNFQTSRFTLLPQAGIARPTVMVDPAPANLVLKNEVRVTAGRCSGANRSVDFITPSGTDKNELTIKGVLAASCGSYDIHRAIMNAPEYAYGTFRTFFTQVGGELEGGLRLGTLPADARLIATFPSLTMAEVVRLVNKFSNNVMARTLLLTLAAETKGTPATMASGRAAIDEWLLAHEIKIPGLVIDNGAGLSRAERITARGMGEMLDIAWHSPFMPEFAASLPLSATDGTLRNRFQAAGMQGRLRLKTGRIDNVSGLAGFVNAASGETYVLVILVNHPNAHLGVAEETQAALVRWVFGRSG
ncbi:MAG TPA: D-alanyl-D-alanine carboxypeptidase/D-alanyl-D-alanine-endopeptidase [Steroidobacteraceae bacterium]|nr:D-alanyl-D-alanine carboxypeptidase/D-alanyl-D-alanine-endopeptidase [Steroidobacteraceae bacterium]